MNRGYSYAYLLTLFLMIGGVVSACAGVATRDRVLPASMGQAFPAVRQDVAAGVAAQNPPLGDEVVAAINLDLAAIETALGEGNRAALLSIDWAGTLRPLAEAGVMARAQSGEIALGVAQSRLERVRLFSESWSAALAR